MPGPFKYNDAFGVDRKVHAIFQVGSSIIPFMPTNIDKQNHLLIGVCVQGAFGTFYNNCSLCSEGKFQALDFTFDGFHAQSADLQRVFTGALIGAPDAIAVQCVDCSFASYQNQSGASFCFNCPSNSNTSNVASSRRTECICNPSYVGLNGGQCSICTAGTVTITPK